MSDDRTTNVSWERLFERAGEIPADLATIESVIAARRGGEDG